MTSQNEREVRLQLVAVQVALKTGLLRRCATHDVIFDPGQHDYQGACMVATYLVNRADPLVAEYLDDRTPLTALLKIICQSYGKSCPKCSAPAGA